jgi:DNA-binding response OmpR family regulator
MPGHPTEPSVKPDLVLVIEDDRDSMDAIVEVLDQNGYRCVRAANGTEAIACLEWGTLPQLILLELNLPVMSADQFLAERSRLALAVRAKVVLISGRKDLESRAGELGAAAWLPKPIQIEDLLGTVRRLTGR